MLSVTWPSKPTIRLGFNFDNQNRWERLRNIPRRVEAALLHFCTAPNGYLLATAVESSSPTLVSHVSLSSLLSRQLLVDKTDQLNQQAFRFDRASRSLSRTMYWRKVKTVVAAGAVGVVLIIAAGATACGGVTFSRCRS